MTTIIVYGLAISQKFGIGWFWLLGFIKQGLINHVEVVLSFCLYLAPRPTAMLQAVRALMIVGIVLGAIGLLVSIFALKCIRIGNMEDSAKATMTLTSGIMFIISGKQGTWGSHSQVCFWECRSKIILAEETQLLPTEHGLNIVQSFSHWDSRLDIKAPLLSTELS